jgi:hypothetical protein
VLYAYCIAPADAPAPSEGLVGVDGAGVREVRDGALRLWLSEGGAAPPTPERLRAHDRVVRAAMRVVTPLPVRFGTRFPDEDAARASLRERREELLASLDRVQGRVEMGVRVLWNEAQREEAAVQLERQSPRNGSGREYLEQRRREREAETGVRRRAEALLDSVEEVLADPEVPSVRSVLPRADIVGTLAHLVQRSALSQYRQRVEQARERLPEVALALSGPWAPYSFV